MFKRSSLDGGNMVVKTSLLSTINLFCNVSFGKNMYHITSASAL